MEMSPELVDIFISSLNFLLFKEISPELEAIMISPIRPSSFISPEEVDKFKDFPSKFSNSKSPELEEIFILFPTKFFI